MPGPFPGMDPWLEQHWGDVHTSIVTYCRNRLQGAMPRDLRARVEERVLLEWEEEGQSTGRHIVPDLRIVEYPRSSPERIGTLGVLEPRPVLKVKPFDEPATERFIEIRDFSTGGRLITVIEVVSPSNKERGGSRNSYLKKRVELHEARVSLVEIDLLRGDHSLDVVPRGQLRSEYRTPYLVTISREDSSGRTYEICRVPLEECLPVLSIPLRPGEPDALLDLQAVLNDAYDDGGYDIIDYEIPPKPPLAGAAAEWADQLLKSKGLR